MLPTKSSLSSGYTPTPNSARESTAHTEIIYFQRINPLTGKFDLTE